MKNFSLKSYMYYAGLQKFVNYVNNLPKNLFWRRMFLWSENVLEPKLEPYYRNCFAVEYNRI